MGIASTFIIVRTGLGVTVNDERSFKESVLGNTTQGSHHPDFPQRRFISWSSRAGDEEEEEAYITRHGSRTEHRFRGDEREEYSMKKQRARDLGAGDING
ncbi:hypothetical protein PQX77_006373 [Marasmius sp. AFHP31]|nr:hypothetical protein PQX77_006373 [Marasmius sp. AFHP31]